MDNLYNFPYSTTAAAAATASEFPENLMMMPSDHHHHDQLQSLIMSSSSDHRIPMFGSPEAALISATASVISEAANCLSPTPTAAFQSHDEDVIKSRIASHPSYPRLLDAYIDCQKVGAPPEIASLLEKIRRENDICKRVTASTYYGADPELDDFMETYCDVLTKYKSDLEKPFDEATAFLNKVGLQLRNLCNSSSATSILSEEGAVTSDEELSAGELEVIEATQPNSEEKELKDRLIRRFGSHISSLKLEFSKKKKKGKLPKEARQTLLEWWNLHYKWPYPTEADKIALAESTGLDQKQINNWFINQRKRHWNPSENMQFAVMDNFPDPFFTDD